MLCDRARQSGNGEFVWLNVCAQTVFSSSIRGDVADARNGHTAENVVEILGIEELGQISYRRRAGEGNTIGRSPGQQRRHAPSIKTVGLHRSIGSDDIATGAGLLQRQRQIVACHGRSWNEKI